MTKDFRKKIKIRTINRVEAKKSIDQQIAAIKTEGNKNTI